MAFLYIVGGSTSAEDSSSGLLLRLIAVSDAEDEEDAVEEVDAAEIDVAETDDAAKASTHSSNKTNRGSGSILVLLALCTSAVPPLGG
jgi:hypothetical protein